MVPSIYLIHKEKDRSKGWTYPPGSAAAAKSSKAREHIICAPRMEVNGVAHARNDVMCKFRQMSFLDFRSPLVAENPKHGFPPETRRTTPSREYPKTKEYPQIQSLGTHVFLNKDQQ